MKSLYSGAGVTTLATHKLSIQQAIGPTNPTSVRASGKGESWPVKSDS